MGQGEIRYDWLFGQPVESWDYVQSWVAERMAADPEAAAIPDEEAEAFFCAAYMIRWMGPKFRALASRAFGVRISGKDHKAVRVSTLAMLRRWKDPKSRDLLMYLVPNSGFGTTPSVAECPERYTDDYMKERYEEQLHLVWLVYIRRHLGRAEDLLDWLPTVAPWALEEYQLWLNISRLTLRRLVYVAVPPAAQVAAAAAAPSPGDLAKRDKEAGVLRQGVRRLTKERKELKQRTRQAELQAKAVLSQARGEVMAARRELKARAAAHEQERAALIRRFEHDLNLVELQQQSARQAFRQELIAGTGVKVLAGQRIAVTDAGEVEPLCRVLVESLGGLYQPEGGGVAVPGAGGLVALEGSLRSLALKQVLIQCDGLYRRKEGRHGVAVAAMQVQAGAVVVDQAAAVVHCGPLAGSLMAEYGAVALALHWLLSVDLPPGAQVEIQSDCRAMLSRLRRRQGARWKRGCMTLDARVRRGLAALQRQRVAVNLHWVPRERVEVVDRLCDKGYRELDWYHRRGSKVTVPLREFLQRVEG